MSATQELLDSLKPNLRQVVYDLVAAAGVDVKGWSLDRFDNPIEPTSNTYRSSQWTFGGGKDPIVTCIWWNELVLQGGEIVRQANARADAEQWERLILDDRRDESVRRRLAPKIKKARLFDKYMNEAYRLRLPVRVVLIDGDRTMTEQADQRSSVASYRQLDTVAWYVHKYDVQTGNCMLVRDVLPPERPVPDPFEGTEEPGFEQDFQELLDDPGLSSTEKESLIKLRVGQGWFRDALIKRWGGCSVTGCKTYPMLIASHIKPWSQCMTRQERLSPDNGLLLTPSLDKLFDGGWISFGDDYQIIISPRLSVTDQSIFGIHRHTRMALKTFPGMKPFLAWHRSNCFA